MAKIIKKWEDGGNLTITYDGDGNGSAIIQSDLNEGIDREMLITFKSRKHSVERKVFQEGLREKFESDDGEFILADGGTFNVLKHNELQ